MEIKDRVCAVTGAGRGLGCRMASMLAMEGAMVYACDVNADAFGDLPAQADRQGWRMDFSACDVSREDSVCAFFARIASRSRTLDVLVNNAGITRDGLLVKVQNGQVAKMALKDFQQVIDVNLTGVFLCGREAAALMAVNDGGVIINISSVCRAGNFGQTNYSAAKAGVDAMTVAWSKELARSKIRVAAIAPGYINTEMVAAIKPETLEKIKAQIPLKRLGAMDEIAATVKFIINKDFINGRILEIDGGLRI